MSTISLEIQQTVTGSKTFLSMTTTGSSSPESRNHSPKMYSSLEGTGSVTPMLSMNDSTWL